MYEEILDFFKNNDVKYRESFGLRDLSSIKIGGMADVAAFPDSENKLIRSIERLKACGIPYRVVGRLSNTLVPDEGYRGVILFVGEIIYHVITPTALTLSCGSRLSSLLPLLSREGIASFNGLYGIPGVVSGLVYNNAGAYSLEISDIFLSARIYDSEKGKIYEIDKSGMHFAHRCSILRENRGLILLSATFERKVDKTENILASVRDHSQRRRASQPLEFPSLGSVFKKPTVGYAAEYIDILGLKGKRIGGAEVSCKHAGFIINRADATAKDFVSLADFVADSVYKNFGILLEKEVEVLS